MRMTSLFALPFLAGCLSAATNGDAHLTYKEFRSFQDAVWQSDLPCNRSRILRLRSCPSTGETRPEGKCADGFLDAKEGRGQLYFRAIFSGAPEARVHALSLRTSSFSGTSLDLDDPDSPGVVTEYPDSDASGILFSHGCPFDRRFPG